MKPFACAQMNRLRKPPKHPSDQGDARWHEPGERALVVENLGPYLVFCGGAIGRWRACLSTNWAIRCMLLMGSRCVR